MKVMSANLISIAVSLFLFSAANISPVIASDAAAVVTRLDGTATALTKGAKTATLLKKNDQVLKGQEVKVGERSRIELKYPDGTVMRFGERATIRMEEVTYDNRTQSKKVKVDLASGKLWANVKKLTTSDSRVEVKTVNAVAGVRGTTYRVDVAEDTSAMVKVYDGAVNVSGIPSKEKEAAKAAGQFTAPVPVSGPTAVPPPYHEVSMEEWTVIVKAMQQISISPQGVASKPQDFSSQQDMDDWVKWNQERDKQFDK